MKFYTYAEMAEIFHVQTSTIRNWKSLGRFKIFGYRRLGKWAKQAVVEEKVVKILAKEVFSIKNRKK